jgi:N-acetylglucosaminyl-diphospho-decaprenol L-rhamnosyltransferase
VTVRVSAVVPTYNGGDRLHRCLDALEAAGNVDDVIVLDGGSTDGSSDRAGGRPGVRLIRMDSTTITERMNVAFPQTRNDFVMMLNDDAFVDPETPARLAEVLMREPRVAVAGARLRYVDGRDQTSAGGYRTLTDAILSALWLNSLSHRLRRPPVRPDPATGLERATWLPLCAALVRKRAFEEVGGFDDRYSFYAEDHDLARELASRGWQIVVRPDAGAVHVGGAGTSASEPGPWFARLHQNRFLYLRKYYPRAWRLYAMVWAARASVYMAVWRARALVCRRRSDERGERSALAWVAAFRQARWPATRSTR